MRKYVILSVNEVEKYQIFIPLVVWAWRFWGWEPLVFYQGNESKSMDLIGKTVNALNLIYVNPIQGYESATVAQTSRLFGANLYLNGLISPDDYLLTSDADMLILSDYFKPDRLTPTAYGKDLTDYHYVMCYMGASAFHWNDLIKPQDKRMDAAMLIEFQKLPRSTWYNKEKIWSVDQEILTTKVLLYGRDKVKHIDRGTDPRTGYPIGRVDRSSWSLNHEVYIDSHLPHDILHNDFSFKKVMDLLHHTWPLEDWRWFATYFKEFKKLI